MGRGRVKRSAIPDGGVSASQDFPNGKDKIANGDCTIEDAYWNRDDAVFVFRQCMISRILLFAVQFLFNFFFPDFPTDAFKGFAGHNEEQSIVDRLLRSLLSGFSRWDAVHFLHIAEYGYSFENSLAFFPLFPFVVYYLTVLWSWMMPFISFSTCLLTTAFCLNLVAFLACGQLLYMLLLSLMNSRKTALIGCIIFSLNPASVFFSAAYSESLFLMLTLAGLLALYTEWISSAARYYLAASFFAFAFLTRSNGLLNLGYIGYQLLLEIVYCPLTQKFFWQEDFMQTLLKAGRSLYIGVICFVMFSSLVLFHGSRMQSMFCSAQSHSYYSRLSLPLINYARENDLVLPGDHDRISWCSMNRSFFNPMPVFYTAIQRKYWDVEFLGYWQLAKIPCFILAAPALIIVAYGVAQQIHNRLDSNVCWFQSLKEILSDRFSILPFAIHATALSLSGIFMYNAEVITRILFSSSPFMYFVLANYMDSRTPKVTTDDVKYPALLPFLTNFCRSHSVHVVLLSYLLGYFFIGTALHVNWLPFT